MPQLRHTINILVIGVLLLASACDDRPKRHITIAVLGDSLVAGYEIEKSQAFPAVLEAKLKENKYDVTVYNDGVSGNTTAQGLARVDDVIAHKPDLVILELGINDLFQNVSPGITSNNLEAIIGKLKAANAHILMVGFRAPPSVGLEYQMPYNLIFPTIAAKEGIRFYPEFLQNIIGRKEYNLPDGLHPNPEGVKVLVDSLYPSVTRAIADLK
jgi:acyl-CoA thioesterase-1